MSPGETVDGLHWHTDIEFEPIPLSTSMFVQSVPSTRNGADGTWVNDQPREEGFYHPESSAELMARRNKLPLNGETAYADTAAALRTLTLPNKQNSKPCWSAGGCERVMSWLIPLVYQNPRTGRSHFTVLFGPLAVRISPPLSGWSISRRVSRLPR